VQKRLDPNASTEDIVLSMLEEGPPPIPPETAKGFKEAKEKWVSSFEKDYVAALLKKNNYNISHAAKEADIDRKYFRKLMQKYDLTSEADD